MREWKSEMLAISRAGHDKDTVYVVLESDENYFWLADGKRRLLETPKNSDTDAVHYAGRPCEKDS